MSPSNLVARLRASPWTSIFVRLVSVAAALAVLAWIGRSATANADAKPTGALAAAVASSLPGAAPPSPSPSASPPSPSSSSSLPPPCSPAAPPPPPASGAARGRATPDDPVVLNQADESELRRLPGVGAKRADAIIALRRRAGRFNRVEDLMRVKGIGRAAIRKWRPLVRLDPLPAADAGAP